jgi:hypothetical protein
MPTNPHNQEQPPVPASHVKGVPILIPPEMVRRIDAVRGTMIPRAAFVKDLIDKALRVHEQAAR